MASRLLRRQVMTLTDAAAARVRELTEAAGKPVAGLRVGVKNGGCAGMSYTMELAEATNPTDEIVEDKGVQPADRPQGGAVPARLADGFQGRPPVGDLRLLQSQRDFGLRLRRKRRDHAGEPRGASRAGLILAAHGRRALKALFEPFRSVTVKRMFGGSGIYAEGMCFAIELKGEVFLKTDCAFASRLFSGGFLAVHLCGEGQVETDILLEPADGRA